MKGADGDCGEAAQGSRAVRHARDSGGVAQPPRTEAVQETRIFVKGSDRDRGKALRESRYLELLAGPGVVPLRSTERASPASSSPAIPEMSINDDGLQDSPRPTARVGPAPSESPIAAGSSPDRRSLTARVDPAPRESAAAGCREAGGVRLLLEEAACSLADVLHERGPMPETEVRGVAVATAGALARVHRAGLVHGDVKPANLLLSHDGLLWLADFDAAAPSDGRALNRISPHRVPLRSRSKPETDILGLAVTLIELASGALADPSVMWKADELRRLGCPPRLSSDISCVLGALHEASARSVEAVFSRRGRFRLPDPVTGSRMRDSTPTIDFSMPTPNTDAWPQYAEPR